MNSIGITLATNGFVVHSHFEDGATETIIAQNKTELMELLSGIITEGEITNG